MKHFSQSPTDPAFVQNPYPFYDETRASGPLFFWDDYVGICATSHDVVSKLLKDRRLGREPLPEQAAPIPARLQPFYDIEAHSMLELEPPRHTRLRSLVLRAFTSRRIAGLTPEIERLSHTLIDAFPGESFDLLPAYCQKIPIIIICRLLGVPEDCADQLLIWSNDMVAMYQARRTRAVEDRAVASSIAFSQFIRDYIEQKRTRPDDDLITQLISAEEEGEKLSTDELITTCILLLNAGHEATVHAMGNAVKTLIEHDHRQINERVVEECLRFDPPLHLFERYVYEDIEVADHTLKRGDKVSCLLAAANRCPAAYDTPNVFDPNRTGPLLTSFGGGIHFCVGAPLARLELLIGLRVLFERCPDLQLSTAPQYANVYHFHGLEALDVQR